MLISRVGIFRIESRCNGRQSTGRSALTTKSVRALDSLEENGLRRLQHGLRDIIVGDYLQQEAVHI